MRATNWLGDAVMSLPAIRAIRQIFPNAHIAIVARPWVAGLGPAGAGYRAAGGGYCGDQA